MSNPIRQQPSVRKGAADSCARPACCLARPTIMSRLKHRVHYCTAVVYKDIPSPTAYNTHSQQRQNKLDCSYGSFWIATAVRGGERTHCRIALLTWFPMGSSRGTSALSNPLTDLPRRAASKRPLLLPCLVSRAVVYHSTHEGYRLSSEQLHRIQVFDSSGSHWRKNERNSLRYRSRCCQFGTAPTNCCVQSLLQRAAAAALVFSGWFGLDVDPKT